MLHELFPVTSVVFSLFTCGLNGASVSKSGRSSGLAPSLAKVYFQICNITFIS